MNSTFFDAAYDEAVKAFNLNEVPVGCVIVKDNTIIARGFNQKEKRHSSIFHAEMMAIYDACNVLGNWRLENCDLYVTLEPCPMCASAIKQSRIRNVYCGLSNLDSKNRKKEEKIFLNDMTNPSTNFYSDLDRDRVKKLMQKFFDIQRKK